MLVVLVVNLKVCVPLLAPPVRHDVERTGVGASQWSDLIFQNVNIEVGSLKMRVKHDVKATDILIVT